MKLVLEQEQKQILSQNMIQSLNILQMGNEELVDYMKKEILENPMIDQDYAKIGPEKEDDRIRKLKWLEEQRQRSYISYSSEEKQNMKEWGEAIQPITLKDSLIFQLLNRNWTREQEMIFRYIAESLDENGYCRCTEEEIAQTVSVEAEQAAFCLSYVKEHCEPAGIGAETLQECLLLQLQRKPEDTSLEERLVTEYLEMLGRKMLVDVARKLEKPVEEIKEALERIRELNPRPAAGFKTPIRVPYIVPDVTVVKFDDRIEIMVNDYDLPQIRVNREYLRMLEETSDEEVKRYLRKNISRMEMLKKNVGKRNETLLRLTADLVERQKAFFLTGDQKLKPYSMEMAALSLDIHVSTVSRTIKEKYLQCCYGQFPLRFFFDKKAGGLDGERSVSMLKQEIHKVISSEDKRNPYSDAKLAEFLSCEGWKVARRTITKYRSELKIPDYRIRRER